MRIKNKKGAGLLMSILIGIMIFAAGMLIVNHLRSDVIDSRASTALDCNNASISDGTKLTCLGIDLVIPGFIIVIVIAAGGAIIAKFLL